MTLLLLTPNANNCKLSQQMVFYYFQAHKATIFFILLYITTISLKWQIQNITFYRQNTSFFEKRIKRTYFASFYSIAQSLKYVLDM